MSRLQTLTHDLGGALTINDNSVTFAYNPAGQIVRREATNSAYAWTGHGNGTTSYEVDGLNRLTSQTTGPTVTSFSHDARGDRLNDDVRSYAYDSETKGRGSPTAPWHYDPLGRLSGASTSATAPPAIAYESYIDNLVAERTPGSSTVQRRHVFGPGTDEPLVWYEGSSRRFLHADERGSIVSVTSDSGALLAINRFDEYGRTETTSPTYMGRFLYTGQRYFGGFGIYHYKNRIYDPGRGRFMQPDPIGYGGGMNRYGYVGGDPVNATDPSGLTPRNLICTGTRLCSHRDGSGAAANYGSGGAYVTSTPGFGSFIRGGGRSNQAVTGATNAACSECIVVTAIVPSDAAGGLGPIGNLDGALQSFQGGCRGQFQCEDTPNRAMARELAPLLRNRNFKSAVLYAAWKSMRTGNEWGFTGRGRADFRQIGSFIEGGSDAISSKVIAERVAMGADLFFHIHPNSGSGYAPWLSSGISNMLHGGDLGVAYYNNILVGAYAFENHKLYWYDGKGLRR